MKLRSKKYRIYFLLQYLFGSLKNITNKVLMVLNDFTKKFLSVVSL